MQVTGPASGTGMSASACDGGVTAWLGPGLTGLTRTEIATVLVLFDVRSLISSTQPRLIDPNLSQNPTFKDSGLRTQASSSSPSAAHWHAQHDQQRARPDSAGHN